MWNKRDSHLLRAIRHSAGGVVLLVTLMCLTLATVLVMGFFSQALLNRQLSFSSSGQARARLVSDAAFDVIVTDLRAEIAAGSNPQTNYGRVVYLPRTNFTMIPYRNAPDSCTNLVRVSRAAQPLWSGSWYSQSGPTRAVTSIATTTTSRDGRFLRSARWAKPLLLPDPVPADFRVPDWILLTRRGPLNGSEPTVTLAANRSATNASYVIGRFAYAVYDVGGLLDINAAGNPFSATENAKRGRLHQATLSLIPGVLDANQLVTWRNAASGVSTNWFFASTNLFRTVYPGDQRFVSRQDLINYATSRSSVLDVSALRYLTTFSREIDAPSYSPATPTATNSQLVTLTKADGTALLSKRFPLSRLKLLTPTATADASSEIYRYFGLSRSSATAPWTYNHGSASRILTLAEIPSTRDPDFFELLSAVIKEGSLGKTAGDPAAPASDTAFRSADLDVSTARQIMRIGACIIDQYDSDSWPTVISFNGNKVFGVENLPYVHRLFDSPYRDGGSQTVSSWWEAEVWNPHQNPPATLTDGPTHFRLTLTGGQAYASVTATVSSTATTFNGSVANFSEGSTFIQFALQSFGEPTLLNQSNASCDHPPADGTGLRGLYIGDVTPTSSIADTNYISAGSIPQNFPVFELQYQAPGGSYITYQVLRNLRDSNRSGSGSPVTTYKGYQVQNPNRGYYWWSDPRNSRFGGGKNSGCPPGQTMRGVDSTSFYPASKTDGNFTSDGPDPVSPGWTLLRTSPTPTHARLGALANNDSSSGTSYKSPDSILRVGDGGLRGTAENPLQANNTAPRPVILNREFRSVGELSYAFRDEPWKTLDFFTRNSADAGLLDVFSVDDASNSTDSVVAGKVSLNTRQPAVLKALLSGTAQRELSPAQVITSNSATIIAQDLVNFTKTLPFVNKADLVTSFSTTTVDGNYPAIKTEREAMVRALGDAGMTRTWNLLIDMVAQAGRFPVGAQNYGDFLVEGERRYWLHLAIDRFTGEVVDSQLEVVYE